MTRSSGSTAQNFLPDVHIEGLNRSIKSPNTGVNSERGEQNKNGHSGEKCHGSSETDNSNRSVEEKVPRKKAVQQPFSDKDLVANQQPQSQRGDKDLATDQLPSSQRGDKNLALNEEPPAQGDQTLPRDNTSDTAPGRNEQQNFLKLGEKFAKQLPEQEREKAHQQVAKQLKRVSETGGQKGVEEAVDKLNEQLKQSNSPYRFNTARMSNGQDFLTLRDKNLEKPKNFLGTEAFSDPKTAGERATEEFKLAGDKFKQPLGQKERDEAHEELAKQLKRIGETAGEKGVDDAVQRLNKDLEKAGSPYHFNLSKPRDYLSLRDKNNHLLNTEQFRDSPTEAANKAAEKFKQNLSDDKERDQALADLAKQLGRVRQVNGEDGMVKMVEKLNDMLRGAHSPYNFRLSFNRDQLQLEEEFRDKGRKFIETPR